MYLYSKYMPGKWSIGKVLLWCACFPLDELAWRSNHTSFWAIAVWAINESREGGKFATRYCLFCESYLRTTKLRQLLRQCFNDKIFSLLILLYLQRSLSCWHHTFHYVWLHLWLPSGLPLLKKAPHDGLYPDNQQPTTMRRILVSRSCNSFACMTCMTTWMNTQFPYLFLGPIKKTLDNSNYFETRINLLQYGNSRLSTQTLLPPASGASKGLKIL